MTNAKLLQKKMRSEEWQLPEKAIINLRPAFTRFPFVVPRNWLLTEQPFFQPRSFWY